mmetsp:Transcript_27501/g.59847  ORF Transcript_27501/g.59847 Transcript_27501/m.59847 type:complete len:201 (+) Transcript_27501:52-654(+)
MLTGPGMLRAVSPGEAGAENRGPRGDAIVLERGTGELRPWTQEPGEAATWRRGERAPPPSCVEEAQLRMGDVALAGISSPPPGLLMSCGEDMISSRGEEGDPRHKVGAAAPISEVLCSPMCPSLGEGLGDLHGEACDALETSGVVLPHGPPKVKRREELRPPAEPSTKEMPRQETERLCNGEPNTRGAAGGDTQRAAASA